MWLLLIRMVSQYLINTYNVSKQKSWLSTTVAWRWSKFQILKLKFGKELELKFGWGWFFCMILKLKQSPNSVVGDLEFGSDSKAELLSIFWAISLIWWKHSNIKSLLCIWQGGRTKCQPDIMPTKGWHYVRTFFCGWHFTHRWEQKDGRWYERMGSVVISEQKNKMGGVQHVYNGRDNIALMQLWSVNTDWGGTREPSMENLKELMQPWALESKLKGTREPSTEGQSQCDPGLERKV